MRHPSRMQRPLRLVFASAAAIALAAAGAAASAAEHTSPQPSGPHSPAQAVPHTTSPRAPAPADSGRTSAASIGSYHRHRDRDDIVVFGDPFWDPLWDVDADLVLGYNPYAYPPRAWTTYGPTGPARRNLVPIELHLHPWKASVIVDDSTLGQARDYNDDSHPLFITPGNHQVELEYPGYETLRFTLNVENGLPRDLHYTLIKGEGMDPRSAEVLTPSRDGSRG